MKNKDQIAQQIKELIQKSNEIFNANKNKQQVVAYMYLIFSFLALSFFGLFAIGPTFTTISELNKQYDDGKEVLKKLQDKNAGLRTLSSQYLDIRPNLQLLTNAIPDSPKVPEITRQIETLANKNNLSVKKLDTGLMELYPLKNSVSQIFSYTVSIVVSGTEKDINTFIADLINVDRILGIDRLSTGKQEGSIFTASITGRAFFFKE